MTHDFDVIVVGARCAGSPTAMLLARGGYRVLLVDRARFPSDTVSTHLIHPPGVAALARWGLLDRVTATGCPPVTTYAFDMGPFVISGSPGTPDTAPVSYAPRRTALDKILLDAAAAAGAEVHEGFVMHELLRDGERVTGIRGRGTNGVPVDVHARIVVGADGLRSSIAQAVKPEAYHAHDPLLVGYYSYFSALPMAGRFEAYDAPGRAIAAWPTNDETTLVIAAWPAAEFEANKTDVEGNWMKALDTVPKLGDRVRAARREERFLGMMVPGYFRKPFGPGWVLVGDAGYNRDFITAQGISDAFRSAEGCAAALEASFSGRETFENAMSAYQLSRDETSTPMYEFTKQFAALAPPSPEMQQLMAAIAGSQGSMDGFARVIGGVTSPAEFFSPENIGRIFAAAAES